MRYIYCPTSFAGLNNTSSCTENVRNVTYRVTSQFAEKHLAFSENKKNVLAQHIFRSDGNYQEIPQKMLVRKCNHYMSFVRPIFRLMTVILLFIALVYRARRCLCPSLRSQAQANHLAVASCSSFLSRFTSNTIAMNSICVNMKHDAT